MEILGLVVLWFVVAVTAGIVAENKGRSAGLWFVICLILTPFMILIVLALPSLKPPAKVEPGPPAADTRPCPQCAETIKRAAKVCRFCGYTLPVSPTGS